MPLREDLLTPIPGENPSGEDLYYDRVFDQIKEARREDDESIPEGDWERSAKKKADFRAVIKLAGDALATRSKDLRLAASLVEAQMKVEGFAVLVPSIELLRALQESFWETLYPVIEEGGDLELRMLSIEAAAKQIGLAVRVMPLTRTGLSYEDYLESRNVGYEKDATSEEKQAVRQDAIEHGKLSAEDFDEAFASSPKSLYVAASAALADGLAAIDRLDEYQKGTYGDDSPNLIRLRETVEQVHMVVEVLLNERRKTEPDPVEALPAAASAETGGGESAPAAEGMPQAPRTHAAVDLSGLSDAYAQVVQGAEAIGAMDPRSPVPYLVCAGLRLGETRMQGESPQPGFAVGPSSEVRHSLRRLAAQGEWQELLHTSLPLLANECGRAWLDLHRYIWQAGQETGANAIAEAVAGILKGVLAVRPELRYWTLEDDTGAANPETQKWLDAVVLQDESGSDSGR
jgi:type VI secretion system protein ImpA